MPYNIYNKVWLEENTIKNIFFSFYLNFSHKIFGGFTKTSYLCNRNQER